MWLYVSQLCKNTNKSSRIGIGNLFSDTVFHNQTDLYIYIYSIHIRLRATNITSTIQYPDIMPIMHLLFIQLFNNMISMEQWLLYFIVNVRCMSKINMDIVKYKCLRCLINMAIRFLMSWALPPPTLSVLFLSLFVCACHCVSISLCAKTTEMWFSAYWKILTAIG